MVGRKGLEPSQIALSVPKTDASTNSAIAPQITDPKTGYCYGCGRNNDEKKIWKQEDTSDQWKIENLKTIKARLSGWQLESFEESYTYKIENGISLFKKSLKNE